MTDKEVISELKYKRSRLIKSLSERDYEIYSRAIGALENQSTLEDKIVDKLVRFKGNSGCDYFTNCTIDNCIGIIKDAFEEIKQ